MPMTTGETKGVMGIEASWGVARHNYGGLDKSCFSWAVALPVTA